MSRATSRLVLTAAVVCLTAVASLAQQTTSSTETKTFKVLAVDGNQLIVRLPEGTRELTVPDDFRFNINGQQMSVRELKVGMKGTATITTRTTVTPVTVTEVKNGTVVVRSGSSIIVPTDEGVRSFTQGEVDKRGVKIMRNGKPVQLSELREGDRLSATIITSQPPRVMTDKEVNATLATAPAAAKAAPPAAPAPAQSAPAAAAPARSAPAASGTSRHNGISGAGAWRGPGRCRRQPARGRSSASRASCRSRLGLPSLSGAAASPARRSGFPQGRARVSAHERGHPSLNPGTEFDSPGYSVPFGLLIAGTAICGPPAAEASGLREAIQTGNREYKTALRHVHQ